MEQDLGHLGCRPGHGSLHHEGRTKDVVVYTDAIQTVILIVAAIVLTMLGLHHVGGWTRLHAQLPSAMFHMIKPATDPNYPWPGMLIGVFLLGQLLLVHGPGFGPAGFLGKKPE